MILTSLGCEQLKEVNYQSDMKIVTGVVSHVEDSGDGWVVVQMEGQSYKFRGTEKELFIGEWNEIVYDTDDMDIEEVWIGEGSAIGTCYE